MARAHTDDAIEAKAESNAALMAIRIAALPSILTLLLFAAKIAELGVHNHWTFSGLDWSRNYVQIKSDEWPSVWVIILESFVSGTAASVALNFTYRNVTQKITAIYQEARGEARSGDASLRDRIADLERQLRAARQQRGEQPRDPEIRESIVPPPSDRPSQGFTPSTSYTPKEIVQGDEDAPTEETIFDILVKCVLAFVTGGLIALLGVYAYTHLIH